MKKLILALALVLLSLCIVACIPEDVPSTPATQPTTTQPTTTTTPPTTPNVVLTGWQDIDGKRYYYDEAGTPLLGWQEIDGCRYYLGEDGAMHTGWLAQENGNYYLDADGVMRTGWLELDGLRYYLAGDGIAVTGWQEVDGLRRYFQPDGSMAVGFVTIEDSRYYFDTEGTVATGWLDVDEKRYYLNQEGIVHIGWLELDGNRYYLKEDGTMAKGMVQIDGVKNYFTSAGAYILLVNPWNYVPEGYAPDLVTLDKYANYSNMLIERTCYDALVQMLRDCEKECSRAVVVSSYRTHEFQQGNYQRKVNFYLNQGYSQAEAERLAAKVVAVPGTSEHQLGLAVDIVDVKWPYLEDEQADMPAQKWLMEHCWEYGFILRYPKGTTEITGIIYEPWHYRYVGLEVAAQIHDAGVTLEEYLDALTEK